MKVSEVVKHTRLPWSVGGSITGNGLSIRIVAGAGPIGSVGNHDIRCGGTAESIADFHYRAAFCGSDLMRANAEFTVTAANAHYDLLAACESMLATCGSSADWKGETHESLKLIEAAIAKAKGAQ